MDTDAEIPDEFFYLFEESREPLTDVAGYLPCGCHGSQREHTCGPLD